MDAPWSLRCEHCKRFFHQTDRFYVGEDGKRMHWDLNTERWCGPIEQVELRSDGEIPD